MNKEVFLANIIQCDEGGYFAEVIGCKGCMAQGETLDEIKENIQNALRSWLEVLREEEPQLYKTWRSNNKARA
ncbi:MAG: type II toxin-antitoxin system HicB family antitoxin [Candidatus Nealsonbacteria bacterium]|nr:type II toxin-antitoxin system HicB family antitoxin [Candidatus Nealsonbacteria bacterium]